MVKEERVVTTREHEMIVGDDVEIFVPSRSRFNRSLTLEALTFGGLADRAVLVVPHAQGNDYVPLARKHKIAKILRCNEDGIAKTRQLCGQTAKNKFIMFDDDLRFIRRNSVDDWRLYEFGKYDFKALMILISRLLDTYAHVCVGPRQHNVVYSTHVPPSGSEPKPHNYPFYIIGRPLRALAYRKKEFLECEHGRVAIMEDFDVTLQLLERGYQNVVITQYAQDQPQTQMTGGCSDYRTKELHEKNVRLMAKLHPNVVTIRQKENTTGGDFGKRIEATIYWKKAYALSMEEIL